MVWCLWILLVLAGCGGAAVPEDDSALVDLQDGPPNIVLLAIDTFRADHLGALGNEWIRTPELDRFAKESIVFEDCASASTWTLPSFATLFTGLLPSDHRTVGGKHTRLPSDVVPMAERLKALGFHNTGFVAVDFLEAPYGMSRGFDRHLSYSEYPVNGRLEKYERRVRNTLKIPPPEPWFLFVHYFDVHDPYEPPGEYSRMYYEGIPQVQPEDPARQIDVIYSPENRISQDPRRRYQWLLGIKDLQYPVAQYAAGVSYVDHHVGAVLDSLRTTGLIDKSIVVVVADHGEHLTEHSIYFTHRLPYQECLHVPLMIRLPGARQAGRRVSTPVSLADFLPTMMELVGAPIDGEIDGRSLVPLMTGGELPPRLLFAEYGARRENWAKSVWDADWRYTEMNIDSLRTAELFDRHADRREETNVAADHPDLVRLYSAALDARFGVERRIFRTPGEAPAPVELDPEVEERLRALGYVDGGGN